jgi:hypothetical protein
MDDEEDKGNKEFQDTLDGPMSNPLVEENGGEKTDSTLVGGLGGDAWELFSRAGVREDSL